MQPNDENLPVENQEVPEPGFTPGAQPPVQPEPVVPSVDGFSQPSEPAVDTTPAEPAPPIPPTEPTTFQPPVTETGPNPEPFQPAPAPAPEPAKPVGFFGKLFGKK
jgi:hypothetical protein